MNQMWYTERRDFEKRYGHKLELHALAIKTLKEIVTVVQE